MQNNLRYIKRTALGCGAVILAMFLCLGGTSLIVNQNCQAGLSKRLPIYPGATIEWEQYSLMRYGMGTTIINLSSPDDPDAVRSWYAVTTGTYLRQAIQTGEFPHRITSGSVSVQENADGEGSDIILYGVCPV